MMNRVVFSIAVIGVSLWACTSLSDESVAMSHRGAPGRWFPRAMVDAIQGDLLELDACRARALVFDQQLALRMARIEDLKLALDASGRALDAMKLAVAAGEAAAKSMAQRVARAEQATKESELRAGRWYRSPVFWFSSGVVIAIVGGVVIYSSMD